MVCVYIQTESDNAFQSYGYLKSSRVYEWALRLVIGHWSVGQLLMGVGGWLSMFTLLTLMSYTPLTLR